METATESFELYSNLIGDYPYEELDIISVFMEGAMEYSGLLMIGYPDTASEELKLLDDGKHYEHIKSHISHEVAHQWFYSVIGNDPYNEPWLDESFAEFLEAFVFPISFFFMNWSNRWGKPSFFPCFNGTLSSIAIARAKRCLLTCAVKEYIINIVNTTN